MQIKEIMDKAVNDKRITLLPNLLSRTPTKENIKIDASIDNVLRIESKVALISLPIFL
jgi:hypothetical protein